MSSQWLILLMFVSFLQLAVTNPIDSVPINNGDEVDTEQNGDLTPGVNTDSADINSAYYYRLTNAYSGPNLALDVDNDGSNYALKMVSISSNSGQYWRFIHLGNNVYNLRNLFLQNAYSLDIINDGINTKPHMAKTGAFTGQRWHLTRQNDGTFKLNNEFTGNNMFLDVYSDTTQFAHMSSNDQEYTGQKWSFNKIRKV